MKNKEKQIIINEDIIHGYSEFNESEYEDCTLDFVQPESLSLELIRREQQKQAKEQ